MNLAEALTDNIIHPESWDGSQIWVCSTCGAYLTYYLGKYHFTCSCHDNLLKG